MTNSEPFKRERSRIWWSLPFGLTCLLRLALGMRSWADALVALVTLAAAGTIVLSAILARRNTRRRRLGRAARTFGEQAAYFQVLQEGRTRGSVLYIGRDRIMLLRGQDIQRQWPRESLVHASVVSVRIGLFPQAALFLSFGRHVWHEQVHLLFPGCGGFGSNRNGAREAVAALEHHPPKALSDRHSSRQL